MVRSNATTSPGPIGPANHQGGLRAGDEISQNRRALSAINQNIIGHPPCHCTVKKRGGLSKENVECSTKNPHIQIHRPITRKFAAELADKIGKSEDPEIVDLEDDEASNEGPVPMFVQHTQAMLEEIDQQMEEVEMEDLEEEEEEELIDIDSSDRKDPLAVVAYIDDIYSYYRKSEQSLYTVPSNYMARQGDINERMRGILIDWLIEVHYKFELMEETLYLTVNLVDRFLAVNPVVRKHLQLVGITAMLLACKYEEVSVPVVEDLIMISDKAYTRKEMLEMERVMVNTLQFNLSIPTPYVFMRRFLKAAQSDREVELVSFFMIELSLVDYKMLKFPPSLLAAAAIFTAQCTVRGLRQWSRTIECHSGYPAEELVECSKMMVVSHQKAGTGKLTGVHRKYNTAKFGYAARSEPAVFLLED